MIQLIYVSAAVKAFTDQELVEILEHARAYNKSKDITGALIYGSGSFIQFLEGDKDEVELLYAKILKDTRHQTCLLVAKEEIKERNFAQWSMAFRLLSDKDIKTMEGYTDFFDKNNAHEYLNIKSKTIANMIRDFRAYNY